MFFLVTRGKVRCSWSIAMLVTLGVLGVSDAMAVSEKDRLKAIRFYESAVTAESQDRIGVAIVDLRRSLQKDPMNYGARLLLGKLHLRTGNFDLAVKELSVVHAKKPTDETELYLARALLRVGRFKDVLEVLPDRNNGTKYLKHSMLVRAEALLAVGKENEALNVYNQVIRIHPSDEVALFGIARAMFAAKKYSAVKDRLQLLLQEDIENAAAWNLMGETELALHNKDDAFVALNRSVRLDPDNPSFLLVRAQAYLETGGYYAARQDIELAKKLSPDNPLVGYLLAAVAYAQGDVRKADVEFTAVKDYFTDFPPALLLGALIRFNNGDMHHAERLLTRYIGFYPSHVHARRALAIVRLRSNQPQSAIEILTTLTQENPGDSESLSYLASAYLRLKRFDKAEEIYRKITKVGGYADTEKAGLILGLLSDFDSAGSENDKADYNKEKKFNQKIVMILNSIYLDDMETANRDTRLLLDKHPDHPILLNILGGIKIAINDFEEARDYLEKAVDVQPDFFPALDNLARLDILENNYYMTEQRLRLLVSQNPGSASIAVYLAKFLLQNGRAQEAVGFLEQKRVEMDDNSQVLDALIRVYFSLDRKLDITDVATALYRRANNNFEEQRFAIYALRDAGMHQVAMDLAYDFISDWNDSPEAHITAAQVFVSAQREDRAIRTLETAKAVFPENRHVSRALVDIAIDMNDIKAAKVVADSVGEYDMGYKARLYADALARLGDTAQAIKILEKEHTLRPSSALAIDLFRARRLDGQTSVAFDRMGEWVQSHPSDKNALREYAGALLIVDRTDEASVAYERLLALEPSSALVLNNYAWLRHRMGKSDAILYAQRAYRISPGSPEIIDTLGWLKVQNGEMHTGLQLLRLSSSIAKHNREITYHLAFALSKTGHNDEAMLLLERILGNNEFFPSRPAAEELYASLISGVGISEGENS